MYFWILKVPEQMQYYQSHHAHPELPSLWEMRLCWRLFLVTVGVFAIGIGLRAFWMQPVPWLAFLMAPGAVMVWYFGRKTLALHKAVFATYRMWHDGA
jgi:uncharacterized membrane protein AbrB (regulator of aidB expression)